MKKIIWLQYYIKWFCYRAFGRLGIRFKKKRFYPGKIDVDVHTANEFIYNYICEKKPALIARFGGSEAMATAETIGISYGLLQHYTRRTFTAITRNAGVFPAEESIVSRFGSLQEEIGKQVDVLGAWSSPMQDYLINEKCPNSVLLTSLGGLEPFFAKKPWTTALKGKKVLVIHPFKETIESQYKKRELLFGGKDILPEFELHVIKAVQTIAYEKDSRFQNWFEALDYMYNEAMKIDFDVAIIGCGAYGMPLAARLKEAGKVAIHLGGVTQILFGIRGRRWDSYAVSKFFNDHWVYPSATETPENAKKIEGACYW